MPTAERYQQYELLRREDGSLWELGRGAMGVTYKAYDTNLRFPVCLKIINSAYLESDMARQRFLREARAAAALRHPNVASVFNLGIDHENYFYVMEFIDGETLEARVKRQGALKPVDALNIALQVARALAVAAKQQLVHRDLKPTNLMLVDEEEELHVKVIDFGLAKVAKDSGEDSGTLTIGGFVGTPHFASPEQIEEGEVDVRSDIYSLGATLYFVLSGQSPFSGSVGQIMSQHLYKPLPMEPLTSLPQCVASLVQQMMAKDRNARPQTAQDLQRAISACLDEIRGSSSSGLQNTGGAQSAFETVDLSFSSGQPLTVGVTVARTYKIVEELIEAPHGRRFLADDLRHNRQVILSVLNPGFLTDGSSFSALQSAVDLLRKAPHRMLREVNSLETFSDCTFLVEENISGISLLDLLRRRSELTAPEVSRLLDLLAPLADHANRCGLKHVDIALSGIHLVDKTSTQSGSPVEVLSRPLTAWETFDAKVDAIDFSFSTAHTETWSGMATQFQGATAEGPRDSYVRLLSLLAYELLGGPRARLASSGQYTPVAMLTREGNAVLRRGLTDDFKSAEEFSRELAATIGAEPTLSLPTESKARVTLDPLRRTPSSVPAQSDSRDRSASTPLRRTPSSIPGPSESKDRSASNPRRTPSSVPGPSESKDQSGSNPLRRTSSSFPLPSESKERKVPESLPRTPPPDTSGDRPGKRMPQIPGWWWVLALAFIALAAIGVYFINLPRPVQEIGTLSIQTKPTGATILLDGKPAQVPPNTFTHVPFGLHQLSATLNNYQPIKENIEVREGMSPDVRLQLKPIQEIAALSVQVEPVGASILLDGKPPQVPPNTFTNVPFGPHQLSAALDGYESVKQDIQVREGMDIRLQLKPLQEVPTLSIQTEPAGASILLDGKPPQIPPNTFTHVPFGPHQLSATLNDYEPFREDIQVQKGTSPDIRLQLRPIQEIASLSIQTDPVGAAILLDGKPPQIPPNTFTRVAFGPHQISATLENYEPFRQDIQVRKGTSPEIRLQLRPIVEIASLSIQTEPVGATILLDGKPPQVPPNTFTHVAFGSHQISATLEDYEPFRQDIQIRKGTSPEIHLLLRPTVDIASLSIQTDPVGAAILLDGKPPQVPPNTFTHVAFGPHQISATLDNYEPVRRDIQIRKGMSPDIRLQLKPIQEIASLTVQSDPTGAAILLDGTPPQSPPNTFTHVPFGTHQLSATLDNYEPLKQDLEVRAGMSPEIQLRLTPNQDSGPENFRLFLRDAQLGDANAMMKVGLLYLKKLTPGDDAEGFQWLNRAYAAHNLEAGAYIADCYLSGRGTKPDVQKAEDIIMPLANQNVVPAMTLAGRILQHKADLTREQAAGSPSLQTRKQLETQANDLDRQARQWWERAQKDDWNAAAHLGQCYEKGWGGVEKSEEQAEKLYKAGVDHANRLCMFFYGLMIEKKPGRRSEAEALIARAAAAGLPSAIQWCKEKNVTFGGKRPDDGP
jgi:serine/threonine protein kinase/TPR repeat protein